MRAQRDGIHPSSIRAGPPRTMRAQLTSPKRHPGGGGIVEGSREQDRRDDDAPGRRGSLPRRRRAPRTLATPPPGRGPPARSSSAGWPRPDVPQGGAHRRTAHRIPGRAPTPPGADAQTDGATGTTGTTDTTGPGLVPAARPRRPPLVGDGAGKPSFGAFPRLSARSYRGCYQLNGPNREKISVNRAPRPAPAHRAPAQRGVR